MEYTLKGSFVDCLKFDSSDLEAMSLFAGVDFDCDETEDEPYAVRSLPGYSWRYIEDGDWVVRFPDGFRVYSASEFEAIFEPLV